MKKLFLVLLLIPIAGFSQQYFRATIYPDDSVNRRILQNAEPLGAVLLHGYLDGKLKAYTFDVKSEDVKWKPIPQELVPEEWNSKLDYYQGDRIAYKGKYYELVFDFVVAGTTPPPNEMWALLDLHGDVVSTIHSFPEARDSTTKTYLLENLAGFPELNFDGWYEDGEYYAGDVILYKGQYYQCIVDHSGKKQPDVESEYWSRLRMQVQFHQPDELNTIGLLYARDDKTTLIPQMLTLFCQDMFLEGWRSPGLNFYYQDVVDYLAQLRQLPLLCDSQAGYVGTPQLLSGGHNIQSVVDLVHEALAIGNLKPTKKDIVDTAKYNRFVRSTRAEVMESTWWATQDLLTNDMWVTSYQASDTIAWYVPIVRVPWKSMEGILKAKESASRLWTYGEALDAGVITGSLDTLDIDTLAAKPFNPVAIPPVSRMFFIEQRTAPMQTNHGLSQAMKSLWTLLKQALDAGTMQLQSPQTRLFVCDQPFPEITFDREGRDWIVEKGFTLDSKYVPLLDSAIITNPVGGVTVQYKRYVTSKKSRAPLFEPIQLSVRFYVPMFKSNTDYLFTWEDIVKLAAGHKDLQGLMDAVRTGKLNFDYSELVYGLIGER